MKRCLIAKILLAALFSLIFLVSAGHAAYVFTDDFSSGINSLYWTTNLENPESSVVWDSGRVLMTQGASYGGDSRGANLVFNFPVSGDFTVRIGYTLVNWPTDSLERSGMRTNFGAVERISDSRFGGERYGTDYSGSISTTPTADLSGTLQLVRTGTTLAGHYWNGTGWTLIGTSPYAASGDMNLELSIWPWTGTAGVQVAFDNFYVCSDTNIPAVPLPAAVWLFGAGLLGLIGVRRKAK